MRRPALLAAMAAVALSGCVDLEPKYQQPAAPVAPAFPYAGADATTVGVDVSAIGWRQIFPDPKLQSVITLALANNRDLRVAIANIESARALYHVQRAAEFPVVDLNGAVAYERTPKGIETLPVTSGTGTGTGTGSGGSTLLATGGTSHGYSLNLGVSEWEIDFFGRIRSLSRAALDQYLATEDARRETQVTLIGEVASDYLTLASDLRILKVARDTVAAGTNSLNITQARLSGGVSSALDLRQAQTIVEQARADIARYTTQVEQDRNALTLVAGAPIPDALLPAETDLEPTLGAVPVGLDSRVLLTRPDVVQAENQLRAANADIGAARAAFFPRITLTAAGGLSSTSLQTLFNASSRAWSFLPNLTLPIFDAGANKANLQYARAQRDLYVAQYEKAIQTAFREVSDALAVRAHIDAQVASDQAVVDAAADTVKLSTARYDEGIAEYLDVLDAQRTLYTAQQTLLTAELSRAANTAVLYRTLGGGLVETTGQAPPPSVSR